jgi:transposase
MQAINAVGRGQSVKDIAAAYGLNTRTIYRWLSQFARGGQKALHAKPIPGRPPTVTPDEMRWIARAVRDECPQQFKFPYGLWTLSLIGKLIERKIGKSLSLASVSRIMKLLGFSAQKPLYEAWQQDPVLVEKWESETYPEIRAEARRLGASIYFADEAGIRSDYHTGTTWAPVGETPVAKVTGRRFALNMISAVSPRGEFRLMLHEGTVTAAVFKCFLQRLLIGPKRPIFLTVDGHPAHKAKLVESFVESTDGQLKLFFLPPYSSHLNPDETDWAHMKRKVANAKAVGIGSLILPTA